MNNVLEQESGGGRGGKGEEGRGRKRECCYSTIESFIITAKTMKHNY